MASKLPPLNALKAFEASARRLSFSQAAEELCVTQGAISKQIKLLEAHLQTALFDRNANGISLTNAGKQYLPSIMNALQTIHSSSAQLQQQNHHNQQLTLNLIPSLASLWLIPRLDKLAAQLPNLTLQIVLGDGQFQFHQNSADIAIRCLPLSLTHENSCLLSKEILVPVIHPNLLAKAPVHNPSDLLQHPLITHVTRPQLWPQFLAHQIEGESNHLNGAIYSHGFEHFFLSLEAAKQQQGIALVPELFARQALENKELINPLDIRYESGFGFYFLSPFYRQQASIDQALLEWFIKELN